LNPTIKHLLEAIAHGLHRVKCNIALLGTEPPFDSPKAYAKACPNEADRKELADAYGDLIDCESDLDSVTKLLEQPK
jgi:hypothetical protein